MSGGIVTPTSFGFTLPDGRGVPERGGELANVPKGVIYIECLVSGVMALVFFL